MEKIGSSLLEWGVATEVVAGESQCGDLHLVEEYPRGALVAAVDGLGHGAAAAEAAEVAVATLRRNAGESIPALVESCHIALRGTRGVVMSLAAFDVRQRTVTAMGIGNVEGYLVRADAHASPPSERFVLRAGVVGQMLPPLRAEVIPVAKGDRLVMVTDGVRDGFSAGFNLRETPQRMADRILAAHKKGTDDALVLVAIFWGQRE